MVHAGSKGIVFLCELTKSVVKHGKTPEDWEMSFILNLYKGKGDALNRGNYRGLKLTEHVMKVMERIVDGMIREMIAIDEMQFAFVPGRGTTDAIFIIRQLQEKFLSRKDLNDKNLTLFFAFVDLEKAFDRVPRKVLWWAMRKVGVEEWIVRLEGILQNMVNPSLTPTQPEGSESPTFSYGGEGIPRAVKQYRFFFFAWKYLPNTWSNQLNQSERLIYAPLGWITTDSGNGLVSSMCQAIAWTKFWFVINCTVRRKLQGCFSRLKKVFGNDMQIVVIFSRPQRVKRFISSRTLL